MRLRKKQSKCEIEYEKSIEQLHEQILTLQTYNKALVSSIDAIECEKVISEHTCKIHENHMKTEIQLLKIDNNLLKLKIQRLDTKVNDIKNILENKTLELLHSDV